MSYGIIRAWKSASEYERVEHFLNAIIQSNKEYILANCSSDIEFTDVVDNTALVGTECLIEHLNAQWNLPKDGFKVTDIEMSYADKSETASFVLKTDNKQIVGLVLIEESNGQISNCKLALTKPS